MGKNKLIGYLDNKAIRRLVLSFVEEMVKMSRRQLCPVDDAKQARIITKHSRK